MNMFEMGFKKNLVEKVVHLRGLNCANCAAKIERQVQSLPQVREVKLDLINQVIHVEVENDNEAIVEQIRTIVKNLEPHVKVFEEVEKDQKEDDIVAWKRELVLISIGACFFVIGLVQTLPFSLKLGLYLFAYLIIGGEVLLRALKNIFKGQILDENFLMTIATIGAFAVGEYPEAVAVMLFYQVGEIFQDLAVDRSRRSIRALLDIRPEYTNIEINGELTQVDPARVKVGEIIVVKPGEKVPLDSIVLKGQSLVDTSALSGESVPRSVKEGDELLAGFINLNGLLTLQVTKIFSESTVVKILHMVQNAGSRKAPTENFITKFARYYTPVVVFLALTIAFVPPLVLGASLSAWIYRGLIFLVVSCPCALVISIPLGFFGGIGGASRQGILIKGGNYLEALNQVQTVVFDKTGTLTKGVFKVIKVQPNSGVKEEELLNYAALAEAHSNHPIAKSICDAYDKPLFLHEGIEYEEITGRGVKALIDQKVILAGNGQMMRENNITVPEGDFGPSTVVHVAVEKNYLGAIYISDEIKADASETIQELRKLGIREIVMLTGDRANIAKKVGADLKLDRVYAGLLPDEKVTKVEEMVKEQELIGKVAFVGDGINDAPVLARADVGVAMGGLGSDAAIEAADIVLMTDEPSKLVDAIKIARKTRSIVWQNIILALSIKGFVLLLGAFGAATMWEAVFADVGVAFIAVLNALRAMYPVKKINSVNI